MDASQIELSLYQLQFKYWGTNVIPVVRVGPHVASVAVPAAWNMRSLTAQPPQMTCPMKASVRDRSLLKTYRANGRSLHSQPA